LSSSATTSSRQRRGRPPARQGSARRRQSRSHTAPLAIETNVLAPDIPWEAIDADAAPIPFSQMQLHPQLMQGLKDLGFEGTRPVQGAVIPRAL